VRWKGLLTLDLDLPTPWLAWAIAGPSGIAVALLGAWRSSKRASRVSPLDETSAAQAAGHRPVAPRQARGAAPAAISRPGMDRRVTP